MTIHCTACAVSEHVSDVWQLFALEQSGWTIPLDLAPCVCGECGEKDDE